MRTAEREILCCDQRTVIDVVEVLVWIVRIVYNECTTKSVAVLSRQVTVIPEGTGLVSDGEVVQERVPSDNRALGYEGRAISPCGPLLEESVPVLEEINEQTKSEKTKRCFYNRCLS